MYTLIAAVAITLIQVFYKDIAHIKDLFKRYNFCACQL